MYIFSGLCSLVEWNDYTRNDITLQNIDGINGIKCADGVFYVYEKDGIEIKKVDGTIGIDEIVTIKLIALMKLIKLLELVEPIKFME